MSIIKPLPAVRYNTAHNRELSARISPPYDILDDADKRRLLARDDRNFVTLDLPHTPPKSAGPPAAYAQVRKTLDAWLADRTLVRDAEPAVYAYHQRYSHTGREYVRKMFFARLHLEPFGTGSVFPHEQTFGGPKEDRLALTKATGVNLSPIFGLYQDPENVVADRLERALEGEPLAVATMDGVENRLWAVTRPAVLDEVARLMAPRSIYIADGHHRYGTGLMHRDWYVTEHGPISDDHPANFVLCVFCAMEDPGLLILPTHRVLPGVKLCRELFAEDERIEVIPFKPADGDAAIASLRPHGAQAIAVYGLSDEPWLAIRPRRADFLREYEPQHSHAWRTLGLAFLHAYLLNRVVAPAVSGGTAPTIQYVKSAEEAVRVARESAGTAFLMQPTTMEELRNVCQAGDLMPQKSTYFYPKLASGLVINPLT